MKPSRELRAVGFRTPGKVSASAVGDSVVLSVVDDPLCTTIGLSVMVLKIRADK